MTLPTVLVKLLETKRNGLPEKNTPDEEVPKEIETL